MACIDNHKELDDSMIIKVIDDEGMETEFEMLLTFESDETGRNYIVYTDNIVDDDGSLRVFASIYDPDLDKSKLLPIETEEEWKMVETILKELQEEPEDD